MTDGHKRPITTFDIVNQRLMVDYEDPADLPKTRTTYDGQRQNLMVDYEDPSDLPKKRTTYDAAVEELTVEYPPTEIGTTQVMNGVTFKFDGKEWIAQ